MFEIILEMESDKEKTITSPEEWGESESEVAKKLCELLEEARSEEWTFVCVNNTVVKVENVWGARVRSKVRKTEDGVIQFPTRRK